MAAKKAPAKNASAPKTSPQRAAAPKPTGKSSARAASATKKAAVKAAASPSAKKKASKGTSTTKAATKATPAGKAGASSKKATAKKVPATKSPTKVPATKATKKAAPVRGASAAKATKGAAPVKSAAPAPHAKTKPSKASATRVTGTKAPLKQAAPKQEAKKAAEPKKSRASASATNGDGAVVTEGQKAPSFELLDQDGAVVRSSDLAGGPYVLYFYPKDNTPGCTQEACDFRDRFPEFSGSGIRVFGVSPDSARSHAGFREKYQLPFPLLVDSEKELAKAYGVWEKKKNYGREYMGIVRSTFVVDGAGVVRKAYRGVRVAGHADAVLAVAKELG